MNRISRSVVAVALLLTGCTSENDDQIWREYYQILKQSVADGFGSHAISREEAAAIPYASLSYRLNGGPEMLVVLATDSSGELLWTSSAHITLLTRDGRILHTVGLSHDISGVTPALGNSLPAPAAVLNQAFTSIRTVDFPDMGIYSVPIACGMTVARRETISILGRPIATVRADENCKSATLNWSFKDNYWLDPASGFVWRSLQHLTPKGDTIETEILRPPG